MHPCLSVDDILRVLARILDESEAKTTVVALACCCKAFEEPMLDELWRTQDELGPLLKCFPQDVWKEEDGCLVSLSAKLITFLQTQPFDLKSLSIESRRKRNGLTPESTLGECGSSQ